MLKRLNELEEKFTEIEAKLANPDVVNNQQLYHKLLKERAELLEVVDVYNQYKRLTKQIEETKQLTNERDKDIRQLAEEELADLKKQQVKLERTLKLLLIPKDPNDSKNVLLEIRAGTGGEEAALFAGDLFRMYSRYAESRGWKVEIMTSNQTGLGGLKEIIAAISGDHVYGCLKYESGVHRVQRVPVTEAAGRIHTSAVSVAVLPEAEEVDVQIDEKDLRIDTFRASGHGGQHVNVTDSAVRITHLPTGIVVSCQDERSQHKNKAKALKILRARIKDKLEQEQANKIASLRKDMVGSGDRSEKIRTYNFPQNRVTDHRINLTLYQLETILDGNLDQIIQPLTEHYQKKYLEQDS